jgi:hypothetical protein
MYLITIAAKNKESFLKSCDIISKIMEKHTSLRKEKWGSKDAYIYLCNKYSLDDPDLEDVLYAQLNVYKGK